jgi:hypothetical protein
MLPESVRTLRPAPPWRASGSLPMSRVNSAHAIMASRHKNRSLPPQMPLSHQGASRAQASQLTKGIAREHQFELQAARKPGSESRAGATRARRRRAQLPGGRAGSVAGVATAASVGSVPQLFRRPAVFCLAPPAAHPVAALHLHSCNRVPAQMWQGWAQSRRGCGRGEPSPGADVAGVSPVPAQMWQG